MANVAVNALGPATLNEITLTPGLLIVRVASPVKFVPVNVTGTAVPLSPDAGLMDVMVGAMAGRIVKSWLAEPPPGAGFVAVTTTSPAVVNNEAGTLTTSEVPVCDNTATPVAPNLTVDDAMKFVPVIVSELVGDP